MTHHADHTAPVFLVDGRVVGPWTCLRCRYGVENLTETDRCPECAEPVARAVDPRLLRFMPLGTLDRVRRGARTIMLALLGAIVSVPGLMIFYIIGEMLISSGRLGPTPLFESPAAVFVVADVLMAVLGLGVFGLTARLPARCAGAGSVSLRRALRVLAILFPLSVVSLQAVALVEWLGGIDLFGMYPPWVFVLGVAFAFGTAAAIALGLPLYAWTIGERTWWRGRPLRAIAVAPAVFGCVTAAMALIIGAVLGPMWTLLERPGWSGLQWVFFSATIAGIAFCAIGLLAALVTMHALRVSLRRDYREAAAAHAGATARTRSEPTP